ncbi:MAG: hypothetical protein JW798_02175 [Prolixibacteraceae bacterium]|nr:hypothetical protein [Prolixibacteraceae bacterium]
MSRLLIFIFFCCFLTLGSSSQHNNGFFYVTGNIKVDQGIVDGTRIEVYRDNALLQNIEVNRTGNFRVVVSLGYVYRFVFNNTAYYPKTIDVDTRVPTEVCETDCSFPPYQLAVILYKKVPGVAGSAQNVGRVSYNPKLDNFDAEILRDEIDLKKLLNDALKETKEKSRRYEQQKVENLKDKYNRHISDGDHFFRIRQYENAMNSYREAVMTDPLQTYPRNQVNKSFQILISQQLDERFGKPSEDNFLTYLNYGDAQFASREYSYAWVAYTKALEVKPDDENVKEKQKAGKAEIDKLNELAMAEVNHKEQVYASRTRRYQELISKADEKLKQEDIAAAKDLYAQAATQIDENSYAILMLQNIGDIVSNDELAKKLARERDEAEKQRLNEARNRAYNDAVKEADALFNRRIFSEALEYYQLALTIKNYELYPQQQIKAINDILARLQLNGEDYNRLLREGEKLMFERDYNAARLCYVEAHKLVPDEKFALQKIEEIDHILQSLKQQEGVRKQYNDEIALADGHFRNKKYDEALQAYEKASKIIPSEPYPKEQINKIREILSRENDEQKRLMQQRNAYDLALQKADNAFNQKSYATARSLYLNALQIIPGQEYPSSQIRKIDQLLLNMKKESELTKSDLEKIDFANLADVSREQREAAYKEAMAMGESFFKAKEWGIARFYFRKALALIPNDHTATERLNQTEANIRDTGSDLFKYQEMVDKAKEAFNAGDFSVSKFYYSKALEAKPGDEDVIERIKVVEQLMKGTMERANSKEFDDVLAKGNAAFGEKNFSLARFYYRKAGSLKPDNQLVIQKLDMVDKALNMSKQAGNKSEFQNYINMANQSIAQKQYALALNYLRRALLLQPGDEGTLKQIEQVEGLINAQ